MKPKPTLVLAFCFLLLLPSICAPGTSSKPIPLRQYKLHELPIDVQKISDCSEPFQEVYDKLGLHRIDRVRFAPSKFDNLIVIAYANYRHTEYIKTNQNTNSCAIALRLSLRKNDNGYLHLFAHKCYIIRDIHSPLYHTFEKKDRDNQNVHYFGLKLNIMKNGKLTPYVLVFVYEKTEDTIKPYDFVYFIQTDDWWNVFDKEDNYMAMNPYFRNDDKQ